MSPHVDPAALQASSGPARRTMLLHLRVCAACRSAAAEHDPSILFGLLALAPIPEPVLDRLSREVAQRVGRDRVAPGVLSRASAWPRRAAAAAVAILTLVTGYTTLHERTEPPPPVFAAAPRRADVDVAAGRGVSQVIDLTVGETQIVMVYNGDLKL